LVLKLARNTVFVKKHPMNLNTPIVAVRRKQAGKENSEQVDPRTVRRRAVKILNNLDKNNSELSILLCNDQFIHTLNRDYRGQNKPTDVLSFSQQSFKHDPPNMQSPNPQILGDVVISIETASRQAKKNNHSLLTEVTILLIHSILHLLGYDHQTPDEESKMSLMTKKIALLFSIKNVNY